MPLIIYNSGLEKPL